MVDKHNETTWLKQNLQFWVPRIKFPLSLFQFFVVLSKLFQCAIQGTFIFFEIADDPIVFDNFSSIIWNPIQL